MNIVRLILEVVWKGTNHRHATVASPTLSTCHEIPATSSSSRSWGLNSKRLFYHSVVSPCNSVVNSTRFQAFLLLPCSRLVPTSYSSVTGHSHRMIPTPPDCEHVYEPAGHNSLPFRLANRSYIVSRRIHSYCWTRKTRQILCEASNRAFLRVCE